MSAASATTPLDRVHARSGLRGVPAGARAVERGVLLRGLQDSLPQPVSAGLPRAAARCAAPGLRGFDAAYCFGAYEGALRELIHLFKYGRMRPLAAPLGDMLARGAAAGGSLRRRGARAAALAPAVAARLQPVGTAGARHRRGAAGFPLVQRGPARCAPPRRRPG